MRYLEMHEKTVIFRHKNKKDKHFDPTFVLAIFSFLTPIECPEFHK